MKFHTLFFFKELGGMLQNLSSASVVIGALRVKSRVYYVIMIIDLVYQSISNK